jgi:hypothetical protein
MIQQVTKLCFVLLFISLPVFADEWQPTDKKLFTGFVALQVIDGLQTYEIAKHPDKFKETNGLYGNPPTVERIILIKTVGTGLVYYLLDNESNEGRRGALWFLDIIYLDVVAHNYEVGIRIGF